MLYIECINSSAANLNNRCSVNQLFFAFFISNHQGRGSDKYFKKVSPWMRMSLTNFEMERGA